MHNKILFNISISVDIQYFLNGVQVLLHIALSEVS
jgi:hypothetical protein